MRFVDTNILLYRISRNDEEARKQRIASDILTARDLALSSQVLQEFYVQATRSTRIGRLTHREAVNFITVFARFPVQATSVALVRAALATCERYVLSYWDAAIIEAARMLGCTEVLSEDLSHGQNFDGLIVIDPFR